MKARGHAELVVYSQGNCARASRQADTSAQRQELLTRLSPHRSIDNALSMQAKLYPRLLAAMKPGATLGLSHGFLLGAMRNDDKDFRDDINVILVAPKVRCKQGAVGCCSHGVNAHVSILVCDDEAVIGLQACHSVSGACQAHCRLHCNSCESST